MHEIVTIQIGQQANYVGTHFWNAQESYFTYSGEEESPVDHDVHFRAGIGADGSDTYLPRVVIYDFKSSFGTLRKMNELYEVLSEDQGRSNIWGGNTSIQRQPPIEPNTYQRHLSQGLPPPKLRSADVRYWSDFNRIYYHPRSLVQIYETDLGPQERAFDTWSSGEDLFTLLDNEHDLFDRDVRPVIEECDQIQGLQILTGVEGGWSGFTSKYVERLRDEMGKAAMWVWVLGEGQDVTASRRANKVVNEARSLFEISSAATMYVPLLSSPRETPSYLSMDRKHPWHTAALQATAIESLTLPSRLRRSQGVNAASLDQLAIALNPSDERKIAQARLEISGAQVQANGAATLSQVVHDCDLSPAENDQDARTFSELSIYRGHEEESEAMGNGHDEDIEHYRRFNAQLRFPLLDSFPTIYSLEDSAESSTPLRAQLAITSATTQWISDIERASRMRIGFDEREALSNGLHEIAEAYKAGFSDDDDWDV